MRIIETDKKGKRLSEEAESSNQTTLFAEEIGEYDTPDIPREEHD